MDPSDTSLVMCKIKGYVSYITMILPPCLVVLACIDRLMLSSSNINVRACSRPRVAYRSIAGVSIFWLIFSSHAFVGTTIFSGPGYSYCYIQEGIYTLLTTLYSIIVNYSLPPILMTILGLLTMINIRQSQRRVRVITHRGYNQSKDRHLLRMLLFQVLINVIFTIPLAAYQVEDLPLYNAQK